MIPSDITSTSVLIAKATPRGIFRHGKPNIRIVTYPDEKRIDHLTWGEDVSRLWDGQKELFGLPSGYKTAPTFHVDAVLHISTLAQPSEEYRLERDAYEGSYTPPDKFGNYRDDSKIPDKTEDAEKRSTDFDVDFIIQRVRSELKVLQFCVYNYNLWGEWRLTHALHLLGCESYHCETSREFS
jgi:hypothetical protein